MKITSFKEEYAFLSNFYPITIPFEGVLYPSVENAFQAAKSIDPEHRALCSASTPGQSKRIGRRVTLIENWENTKLGLMKSLVRRKFYNPDLAALLIATGNIELIEGNTWGDQFWGVCDGIGENHLGKILMEIRDECNSTEE